MSVKNGTHKTCYYSLSKVDAETVGAKRHTVSVCVSEAGAVRSTTVYSKIKDIENINKNMLL